MNKLVIFFFFLLNSLIYVAAVPSRVRPSNDLEGHLRKQLEQRGLSNNKPFNLQDSINYKRQHNYELYVDSDQKLRQHKTRVDEPRQVLKGNVPDLRYAINDAEIIFNVYPFEPRYEKKILRETLKPASLCYILTGLLLPKLDAIKIDNAPLYGLIIKGIRDSSNSVQNDFEIYAVLSNTEYPLGRFSFPQTKELHYQFPFLIDYYENQDGFNRKQFSYICSLPKFLIDVFYTTKEGLKFNFNGTEISADELFPITITYFRENSKSIPQQKETPSSSDISKAIDVIKKTGKDLTYRSVTNAGAVGDGVETPAQRILLNSSFSNVKSELRQFLSRPQSNTITQNNVPYYFLILSQSILKNSSSSVIKKSSKISQLDISDIKKKTNGSLQSFTLKVKLENGTTIEVRGSVAKNTQIPLPTDLKEGDFISAPVSTGWGIVLTPKGLKYNFCNYEDDLSKLFDYKINKLADSVGGSLN